MNAPKPPSLPVTPAEDPAVGAFENAADDALTDAERIAFEKAMARPGAGLSSEELLRRLRPKP